MRRQEATEMARYLIAFNDGDMTFPKEELADVVRDVTAVRREAKADGIWVFSAGLESHEVVSVVAPDGTITDCPNSEGKSHLGGFAIVDVSSREEAIEWAARIAAACRCSQEVFELLPPSRDELEEE
jgi:hypothetical protein